MRTENQLQPVTFEQAKRLKEAGFDWNSPYCYKYLTPTVALALKWFGNRKRYYGYIVPMVFSDEFNYRIKHPDYLGHKGSIFRYDTSDEAESALLDELLNLIEQSKIKQL